jgi:hypothetical protein
LLEAANDTKLPNDEYEAHWLYGAVIGPTLPVSFVEHGIATTPCTYLGVAVAWSSADCAEAVALGSQASEAGSENSNVQTAAIAAIANVATAAHVLPVTNLQPMAATKPMPKT